MNVKKVCFSQFIRYSCRAFTAFLFNFQFCLIAAFLGDFQDVAAKLSVDIDYLIAVYILFGIMHGHLKWSAFIHLFRNEFLLHLSLENRPILAYVANIVWKINKYNLFIRIGWTMNWCMRYCSRSSLSKYFVSRGIWEWDEYRKKTCARLRCSSCIFC